MSVNLWVFLESKLLEGLGELFSSWDDLYSDGVVESIVFQFPAWGRKCDLLGSSCTVNEKGSSGGSKGAQVQKGLFSLTKRVNFRRKIWFWRIFQKKS